MPNNFSDQEGTTSDEWAIGPTRLLGDFAGDISLGAIAAPWRILGSGGTHAVSPGRVAITATSPVTLTLPVSAREGDAIEIENIGRATITLNATVNGQIGQLITAEIKSSRIVWAGGWRCGDSAYRYNLTGGFTDGAAISTTDEILYAIGTNLGTQSWVNPHTAGRVAIVRSSVGEGTDAAVCDRVVAGRNYTQSAVGGWYSIDFGADSSGRQVLPSKFRFQHGWESSSYRCLSLIVEGSNNVASNTVGGINAAYWSVITTLSALGLAAVGYSWSAELSLPGPAWYRWIRFRMVGADSSGAYNLMMSEIAIGGQLRYV